MERGFDKSQLSQFDKNLRTMVDRSYNLCLHQCNQDDIQLSQCKNSCFKDIIVPFRRSTHVARETEELEYRRCLGQRESFPALTSDDFTSCSNNLYQDRVKVLTDKFASEA